MTTEAEQPRDFAAFEAAVDAGEPDTPPVADGAIPEVNDAETPLELTDEDELVEDEDAPPEHKQRSKSAKQRIDELTKARREAERERDELRAQLSGRPAPADQSATLAELKAKRPDPNDEKYEFGSASEEYQEDLTDWKVEVKLAERDAKAQTESARNDAAQTITALDTNWTEQQTKGAEKYEDFDEKIEDFKANAPCPPLVAAAIAHSPVGEDIAYHLATNQTEAKLIAAELLTGDEASVLSACRRFGEIEGQFLDKEPPMPRNGGPLDMAHYAGQLKAWSAKAKRPAELRVTNAPVPPKHGVRGAGGKFQKDTADMDFAEFEAHQKRTATK